MVKADPRKAALETSLEAVYFQEPDKLLIDLIRDADRVMEPIKKAMAADDWKGFVEIMEKRSKTDNQELLHKYDALLSGHKMPASKNVIKMAEEKLMEFANVLCAVSANNGLCEERVTADSADKGKIVGQLLEKWQKKGLSLNKIPEVVQKRCIHLKPSSAGRFRSATPPAAMAGSPA